MVARVGLFGGTFDPVHLGHLILAEQARQQLRLQCVRLIPAAIPPHKQETRISDGKHRLEMARLAAAGNPALDACDIELRRGGVSYTVETLRTLHEENPGDELVLLVGGDSLADLPTWRELGEILALAELAVAYRPGTPAPDFSRLAGLVSAERLAAMSQAVIEMPLIEIAARDVRRRVAQGQSIRYLVPAAVEAYIQAHDLYADPEICRA